MFFPPNDSVLVFLFWSGFRWFNYFRRRFGRRITIRKEARMNLRSSGSDSWRPRRSRRSSRTGKQLRWAAFAASLLCLACLAFFGMRLPFDGEPSLYSLSILFAFKWNETEKKWKKKRENSPNFPPLKSKCGLHYRGQRAHCTGNASHKLGDPLDRDVIVLSSYNARITVSLLQWTWAR